MFERNPKPSGGSPCRTSKARSQHPWLRAAKQRPSTQFFRIITFNTSEGAFHVTSTKAAQKLDVHWLEARTLAAVGATSTGVPKPSLPIDEKPVIAVLDGPTGTEHAADVVNIIQRHVSASGLLPRDVTILPLVVEDHAGKVIPAELIQAVASAKANGATVANLSFRLNSLSSEELDALADAARGLPLVVAAPNDGQRTALALALKAKGFDALVVGASNGHGRRSSFSDYGPGIIAAPGQRLRVNDPGFGRRLVSGTSFAAAWESAAVAITAARHPGMSPAQAADRVRRSAPMVQSLEEGPSSTKTVRGTPGTLVGAKGDQLTLAQQRHRQRHKHLQGGRRQAERCFAED